MDLDLVVKDPIVRGALALFPLFSDGPAAPAYLTGPEAEEAGVFQIGEADGGAVPLLTATNTGTTPVLLVEGETLLGAKQNRTLNLSVLVPVGEPLHIPVSCVEAGRWGTPRAAGRSMRHEPADLRRVKTESVARARRAGGAPMSDQARVWERIAEYETVNQTHSSTRALEDVFESVGRELAPMVDDLTPLPDQRGVIVAVAGRVRGIDWFDKASTLAAYWSGLVQGYAVDALHVRGDAPSITDAEAFVERVRGTETTSAPAVGLGQDQVIDGSGVAGHALEWEGAVVHLAAFATDELSPTQRRSARIDRSRWVR